MLLRRGSFGCAQGRAGVIAVMIIVAAAVAALVIYFYAGFYGTRDKIGTGGQGRLGAVNAPPLPPSRPAAAAKPEIIDYARISDKKKDEIDARMDARKKKYGVDKSLDMIVRPGESLKVGSTTVPVQDILDKMAAKRGKIVVEDVDGVKRLSGNPTELGIYVVQPGDNIWNIHFNLLKEYFRNKGVTLAASADEPHPGGFSSGVGKILKFSENMVNIYNMKTGKLDTDLNLIEPLSKIVIYNMNDVFALLDQIDYSQVDMIQFDGDTLWIPASPGKASGKSVH